MFTVRRLKNGVCFGCGNKVNNEINKMIERNIHYVIIVVIFMKKYVMM